MRLPSMLHGKKGFERIAWAFKNVLDHSVAWLFCDLTSESDGLTKGGCLPFTVIRKFNLFLTWKMDRRYASSETSTTDR